MGSELLTLDGGFIRPLTPSEYDTSANPVAGTNWKVITSLGNTNLRAQTRNVTTDTAINSLTIDHQASTAQQDVVFIETGTTLTINSGIINLTSFAQQDSANMTPTIRGGTLDMNGQTALINSSVFWEDTNRNDANYYNYLTGNSVFINSSITNANGLIKTGRNSLYLDNANSFTGGNAYVTGEGSLILRHSQALNGLGEVVLSGKGNFLLDNGVNVSGINLRIQPQDTSRVGLRSETNRHATWGGDVILDNADSAGSSDFDQVTITARNNATLSIMGNIYVDPASSAAQTDSDAFNDPFTISTSIAEAGTINLFGQVRDLPNGNIANPIDGDPTITRVHRAGGDQAPTTPSAS